MNRFQTLLSTALNLRPLRLAEAERKRPAALAAAASLAHGRNTARFAPLHSHGTPLGDDLGRA